MAYTTYERVLDTAEEDNITIKDVTPDDVTLKAVFELDSYLDGGGLDRDEVAAIVVLRFDGQVQLIAAGENRGARVERKKREEIEDVLESRKVIKSTNLSMTYTTGSNCWKLLGGVWVNICR